MQIQLAGPLLIAVAFGAFAATANAQGINQSRSPTVAARTTDNRIGSWGCSIQSSAGIWPIQGEHGRLYSGRFTPPVRHFILQVRPVQSKEYKFLGCAPRSPVAAVAEVKPKLFGNDWFGVTDPTTFKRELKLLSVHFLGFSCGSVFAMTENGDFTTSNILATASVATVATGTCKKLK